MPFKGKSQPAALPPSPEALYRDLPRRRDSVPGLWVHQGDLLREYAADHMDTGNHRNRNLPNSPLSCGGLGAGTIRLA